MGQSAGVASYHPGYTRPVDPPPVKNRGSTDLADRPASQDLRAWTLGRPASSYLKHLELALLELVQAMLQLADSWAVEHHVTGCHDIDSR